MAEGQPIGSPTNVDDSDKTTYLHECEPCKYDEIVIEGVGYCKVCKEFLCHPCVKAHQKNKASRSHKIKLLEGKEMHKTKKTKKTGSSSKKDHAVDRCKLHKHNAAQFYCQIHDDVFCDDCRAANHKKCDDVQNVDDVYAGAYDDKEVARILAETHSLMGKFKTLRQKGGTAVHELAKQRESCFQEMKAFRDKIMKRLDQIEADMYTEINAFVDNRSREITSGIDALDNVSKAIEKDVGKLESVSGEKYVYIAIKKVGLPKLTATYTEMEHESFKTTIKFDYQAILDDMFDKERLFGCFHFKPAAANLMDSALMDDVSGKTLIKAGNCNVKHEDDESGSVITGLQFLSSGELLMCDNNNDNLKLADNKMRVKLSIKLPGQPWGLALVGDKEAVVTRSAQHKIQFVTVGDKLTLGREVNIGRRCYGVACSKDKIYVTCHDNPGSAEVLVLNKQGAILTRIARQEHRPDYIAVDAQGSIYLSDWGTETVTCMNSAGKTEYTYKDEELRYPGQLLVDANQYVYVCGWLSHNVQIITDKGDTYKTLLTPEDGIVHPSCLAYRKSDRTLALGPADSDNIVFYKFQ